MSSFPTTGFSYSAQTLGTHGLTGQTDKVVGFAPVLQPPVKVESQQVYQPAAVFEPTPIVHGRQYVEPRPDLKLRPYVEPRATIHPPPRYVPGVTWHTHDKLLPGKHYSERDTFAPRKTVHPLPRVQLEWIKNERPPEPAELVTPSPFVAPWECLPQPSAPANNGARHTVKLQPDSSDVSRTGMMLDLFL